jgi:hypothetical protein
MDVRITEVARLSTFVPDIGPTGFTFTNTSSTTGGSSPGPCGGDLSTVPAAPVPVPMGLLHSRNSMGVSELARRECCEGRDFGTNGAGRKRCRSVVPDQSGRHCFSLESDASIETERWDLWRGYENEDASSGHSTDAPRGCRDFASRRRGESSILAGEVVVGKTITGSLVLARVVRGHRDLRGTHRTCWRAFRRRHGGNCVLHMGDCPSAAGVCVPCFGLPP